MSKNHLYEIIFFGLTEKNKHYLIINVHSKSGNKILFGNL